MEKQDLERFINSLNIRNVYNEKEYEYDEPSELVILQLEKPVNVSTELKNGFFGCFVDEFHLDATHEKLHYVFEGDEIYEASLYLIQNISCEEVAV